MEASKHHLGPGEAEMLSCGLGDIASNHRQGRLDCLQNKFSANWQIPKGSMSSKCKCIQYWTRNRHNVSHWIVLYTPLYQYLRYKTTDHCTRLSIQEYRGIPTPESSHKRKTKEKEKPGKNRKNKNEEK